MVVHPEVIVTPDCPTVKFRQPREQVKLEVELPKILQAQGWGCGTYFHVQFISHDKTELLASGRFVVVGEKESVETTDDPYRPVTKTVYSRKFAQIGDWWSAAVVETILDKADVVANPPGVERKATWNPGKKKYEVKSGNEVVFESADKQEALDVAEGKRPLPIAA